MLTKVLIVFNFMTAGFVLGVWFALWLNERSRRSKLPSLSHFALAWATILNIGIGYFNFKKL